MDGLKQQDAQLQKNLKQKSKVLSKIAIDRYKSSGFGQSIELLFDSDPKKYLEDAATLEVLIKNYETQIRQFKTAKQRVQSSELEIADRQAQLIRQQSVLAKDLKDANLALKKAESLLGKLKAEDRAQLLKKEISRENTIFQKSKKLAQTFSSDGSKGSIALKYALEQIGDIYVWAGAGPTKWDCSGLTMRSFQKAGVSLPHSAAIQFNYGKSISYGNVKPGDLLFFGKPISHVSIYMGKGMMVQAPRPGKKVEVVPLTRMFGYKPFIGAKRI
jgi:cell wall-associated NlpC family hydrolase